jgi:hypothetical protein
MHLQIRTAPALSPADLKAFLAVLEKAGINIEAAGGSDVEKGGEFAFAVAHGDEDAAIKALEAEGYRPRMMEVYNDVLSNKPGELLRFVARVAGRNAQRGWVIKDLSLGVPDKNGRIQVQIYSDVP